jgi:hypothetical protein
MDDPEVKITTKLVIPEIIDGTWEQSSQDFYFIYGYPQYTLLVRTNVYTIRL